jgi:hypothetical protein
VSVRLKETKGEGFEGKSGDLKKRQKSEDNKMEKLTKHR